MTVATLNSQVRPGQAATKRLLTVRFSPERALVLMFTLILLTEGMYLPVLYAHGVPAEVVRALLYLKYGVAAVLFVFFLLRSCASGFWVKPFEVVGLLTLTYIMFSSLAHWLGADDAEPAIYTLFIFPLILYFGGRSLNLGAQSLQRAIRYILALYFLMFAYALFDILFIGPNFWRDIAQQEHFLVVVKGFREAAIIHGVIGNFYFDPHNLMIRRAVGTQGDPLAFAYSAVLPVALLLFTGTSLVRNQRLRRFLVFIGFVALTASLTRAIILSLAFVLLMQAVLRRSFVAMGLITSFLAILLIASSGPMLVERLGYVDSSTLGHVQSLAAVFDTQPLHFLLGAKILAQDTRHFFESGFLNVLSNYGVIAAAGLFFFVFRLLVNMVCIRSRLLLGLAVAGTVGAVTSIVFSESFFSFTGFGLFWFLAGIAMSTYRDQTKSAKWVLEQPDDA